VTLNAEHIITEAMVEGTVSFERGDGWLCPWRIPFEERELFPPQGMMDRSALAAGVRLRIATNSANIGLETEPLDYAGLEPEGAFDLVVGGKLIETIPAVQGGSRTIFAPIQSGSKVAEIWMPVRIRIRLRRLLLDEGASLATPAEARRRWTTYGSSITFCGECHSPARAWPAVVAREKNLNMTCLGFAGQCHMEPMVARLLRDIPADMISLKLGINIHGGTLSERTFKPALIGMVKMIREKQPLVPIAIISPIISPDREKKPGKTGMTLEMMRAELEDGTHRLVAHGDKHLKYFDGRLLLNETQAEKYLPDGLHPNGDGYELMGSRFGERIFPWFVSQLLH
jgi:lysophospholipase L1-like esterase